MVNGVESLCRRRGSRVYHYVRTNYYFSFLYSTALSKQYVTLGITIKLFYRLIFKP